MKTKAKILAGSIVAAALLIGCGGLTGVNSISNKALKATNLKGAPEWVKSGSQGDMSAVGDADIVGGDIGFARAQALALARDEISKQVEVKVKGAIEIAKAASNSGMGDASMQSAASQIAQQSSSSILSGTKQTDTWINDDGSRIYVLAKLSPENKAKLEANVKKQVSQNKLLPADIKNQIMSNIDFESVSE